MAETPPVTPDGPVKSDDSWRCATCGYRLAGLPARGACPECGGTYAPHLLLKPWPGAGRICWLLGWPILGVVIGASLMSASTGPEVIFGIVILWAMLVAIPVNSYFRVRALLKDSLPDSIRRRGFVAAFRFIGTTVCIVLFLVFFGVPVACAGMCLTM